MSLSIRTATPADVDTLLSLVASAYRGEESRKGWTTEADLLTGDRIDKAGMLAKIGEPSGAMLLAMDTSGALVACCELRVVGQDDGIGFFGLLAVEPRRQGGGFGKKIMESAESYARETLGVKRLEMQVIGTRAELIAWYTRRGYKVTGEKRPFPYEQLVDSATALRDDLYFTILEKDLVASKEVVSDT